MKKMTKGAIVTGLGVALLLGGGGTLAVWNDSAESSAGAVVSGDLDLRDPQAGVWTDAAGDRVDIASYRVVPGDKLTYTQKVTPVLDGDKLNAKLTVTGVEALKAQESKNISISDPVLTKEDGTVLPSVLTEADSNNAVIAKTTFTFKSTADKRENVNETWKFSSIGYFLEQQAPTSTP